MPDTQAQKAPSPGPRHSCRVIERASSSLDVAHELIARKELPVWDSVVVLEQTAGRGQMRRVWTSPPGNLYAALRLPLAPPFLGLEAAPALGLLLADALGGLGYSVKIKWPNDILQKKDSHGHWFKVGGILLEEKGGALVAGIGLNLESAPGTSLMREKHAFPAGILGRDGIFSASSQGSRNHEKIEPDAACDLWPRLAEALFSCYFHSISLDAVTGWLDLVPAHLAFLGQRVRLSECQTVEQVLGLPGAGSIEIESECVGRLKGLSANGALQLDMGGDIRSFLGGSLSLVD